MNWVPVDNLTTTVSLIYSAQERNDMSVSLNNINSCKGVLPYDRTPLS